MRFYDVNSGSIDVSGTDIREMTRYSLRHGFGMVLQETWLKAGTIRENIVMGKPDATDEEIIEAAKASHSYGFIKGCLMALILLLVKTEVCHRVRSSSYV